MAKRYQKLAGRWKRLRSWRRNVIFQKLASLMEVKHEFMDFLQGLSKEEMELLDQLNMEATKVE
jgi:hypothetical protein